MIRTILLWLGIIIVIVLVIVWFITGGVGKTVRAAQNMTSSLNLIFWSSTSTPSGEFRLPWQPDLPRGPSLSDASETSDGAEERQTLEEELSASQKEYDVLQKQVENAKTFGEPSPQRGKVQISRGTADGPLSEEYVKIEAAYDDSAPISIGGWALQSALTGVVAPIPRGATLFVLGAINRQENIYLNPGASAAIASPPSPVGTSFRENMCTGYLDSLRTFIPPLPRDCPPASESLPLTAENLRAYGDACYDFVSTLSSCMFPQEIPSNLSPSCHIFLSNTLSYNGCVQAYRYKGDFTRNSWRIFLNSGRELWRNTHDVIRLLDESGRTVDVVSY